MRRTAQELGIARSTLYLKMNKFGLKKNDCDKGERLPEQDAVTAPECTRD